MLFSMQGAVRLLIVDANLANLVVDAIFVKFHVSLLQCPAELRRWYSSMSVDAALGRLSHKRTTMNFTNDSSDMNAYLSHLARLWRFDLCLAAISAFP